MNLRFHLRHPIDAILNGTPSVHNVERVFLGIRGKTSGFPLIQEIGDLAAHFDERDKGLICKRLKSFFLDLQFSINRSIPLEDQQLPNYTEEMLRYRLHFMNDVADYNMHNTKKATLYHAVDKVLKQNTDGTFRLLKDTKLFLERNIVTQLLHRYQIGPLFDENQLFNELSAVLARNQLMEEKQIHLLKKQMNYIVSYILSRMHGISMNFDGCQMAFTSLASVADIDGDPPNIDTSLLAITGNIELPDKPTSFFNMKLFKSRLRTKDWICPSAKRISLPYGGVSMEQIDFRVPVECNDEFILVPIRRTTSTK